MRDKPKQAELDPLGDVGSLRQLITNFTIPPPEDDPRLRAAIMQQCRTGLLVLGMIWTIAPFVLLIGFTVIDALGLAGPIPLPMRELYLLEMMLFAGGLLILWFIRSAKRVQYARIIITIDALFFMAMLGRLEVYAGWSGFSTRMPYLMLLIAALIPFRPMQALGFAVCSVLGYLLGARLLVTDALIAASARVSDAMWLGGLFGIAAVKVSGGLYMQRRRAALASIERDEANEALEASLAATEKANQRLTEYAAELEQRGRELRDAQSQLVQSEKMASLGALVAGISHELNTPLGSIASNNDLAAHAVQLLEDSEGKSDDKAARRRTRALAGLREAMRVNAEAGDRVASLVRSMQSFAGLDESEIKKVDLHAGLDSAVELLRHRTGSRITIDKRYGELPYVAVYAGRINQLFLNLLTNAVQAIEGEGHITIETRHDIADDVIVVAIGDDGRGISADRLEHIFEPGYTTKKGVGVGLGLGLSIAYRVARQHGGHIDVTSEPGKGSRFAVHLPRDHAANARGASSSVSSPALPSKD